MNKPKLLIVTGMSGAGKTQAMQCLEDLGYYCIDNLPPELISKFAELVSQSTGKVDKIALVIDIRGGSFFEKVYDVLEDLDNQGLHYEIVFLEASDETLVRRYKESRRRHPLGEKGEILEVIQQEREFLRELRGRANKIIDTSGIGTQQLKEEIASVYGSMGNTGSKLLITVMSFGFKYGIPLDADMVFDVRFLPNPHYVPELRKLTGNDQAVQEYVLNSDMTTAFMEKLTGFIDFLIPNFIKEGKSTLTVAIGCTGGMHRSVTLANKLVDFIRDKGFRATVKHRDIMRL